MAPVPDRFAQSEFDPPDGSTRVVLVRHGQSIPARRGELFELLDGHGNPPLSGRGRWQAEQVADRLSGEPIDAIYASTLIRTQESAAPLARRLGLDVRVERDLREVFLGIGEGGRYREMAHENHPAVLAAKAERDWGAIPEAESNLELTERVVAVIERLHRIHRNEVVVVFCHGGVIGAAIGHVLSVNPFRMSGSRNGSLSEIVRTPDEWVLRSFNDAGHIGSLFRDGDPPA